MLAAIGCVVGVGALLWLWGGLAGRCSATAGRPWPAGSSRACWCGCRRGCRTRRRRGRRAARPRLPGPVGFYAALGAARGRWRERRRWPRAARSLARGAGDGGARWAARPSCGRCAGSPQRRPAGARAPDRGSLLCAEQRHALVAFGPPQSGKSAGLAVPALLEWDGPAVASSIKTDLLGGHGRAARQLGKVFVFDPFALAGGAVAHLVAAARATTWDGALEVAWRLAAAGELDQRGVEGGDFWAIAAEQRLAPLLYAAARDRRRDRQRSSAGPTGRAGASSHEALARATGEAGDERELADAHAAYDAVRAFEAQADRTRSSIEATAQALLRAYRFARVARSARSCEITADRLLDERATLYLIGDAKASKLLRPIFLALLSEVVDRAYERATLAGGRLELPLLLCLDEAGNVAPLPNLAEIASTAPSHNIQLVSIFHDLAQARSRYGRQAETVVNSHRARMLLPGVADLETLRYFAGLIGEEEARELTRTTGAGGTTRSTARRRRPLVAAEALRQLPDGHALLLYGRLAPARLRLRMWFEDRRLRRLAGGP